MSGATSTSKTVSIMTTQQVEVKLDRTIPTGATAVEPTFAFDTSSLTVTKGNAFTPASESALIQPSGGKAGTYTVTLDSGTTAEDTLTVVVTEPPVETDAFDLSTAPIISNYTPPA